VVCFMDLHALIFGNISGDPKNKLGKR